MKKMSPREQIKSLRSKRTALLKQKNLSMQRRMAVAQQAAQQAAVQEQVQQQKKPMKKTFLVTIYER